MIRAFLYSYHSNRIRFLSDKMKLIRTMSDNEEIPIMKRILTVLLTVLLLCTSTLTARIVFADEESPDTGSSFDTQEITELSVEEDDEEDELDVPLSSSEEGDGQAEPDLQHDVEPVSEQEMEEEPVFEEDGSGEITGTSSSEGYAYAVLSGNYYLGKGTLTFVRSNTKYAASDQNTDFEDIYGNEYYGKIYPDVETLKAEWYEDVPWESDKDRISSVKVAEGQTIKPVSTAYWFADLSNLNSVILDGLDTSKVTDMTAMFENCSSVKELDLSFFKTSRVTNMSHMFDGCDSLVTLNISGFDTSAVTDMTRMFYLCTSLPELDVSHFNTSKVTELYGTFGYCSALKSLNISKFDTTNVTSMRYMFYECSSLEKLDLSHFNTAKVRDMSQMFEGSSSLKELHLSNFNTSRLEWMIEMFCGCSSLEVLDISSFNTAKVVDMYDLFTGCDSLAAVRLGLKWTKWNCEAYLPYGTWTNGSLIKDETALYQEYAKNASKWAGWWRRGSFEFENIVVSYHRNSPDSSDFINTRKTSKNSIKVEDYSMFTRDGYSLVAWNTSADGKGMRLEPGQVISNNSGNCYYVDLYAQWEQTDYRQYTQTWLLAGKGSVEGSIGPNGGIKFGTAEIEAGVAAAALNIEGAGSICVKKEHKGNIDKLTVENSLNAKAIGKVKGPTAKIQEKVLESNLLDISSEAGLSAGLTLSSSMVIDNYDPRNLEQLNGIGLYFLGIFAIETGNVYLLKLYDHLSNNNVVQDVNSAIVGTDLYGKITGKVGRFSTFSPASIEDRLRLYTTTRENISNWSLSVAREAGSEITVEGKLFDFEKDLPIASQFDNHSLSSGKVLIGSKISTLKDHDRISSVTFSESESYLDTDLIYGKENKSTHSLTYDNGEAEKFVSTNSDVKRFADSMYSFVLLGGYSTDIASKARVEDYSKIADLAKNSYSAVGRYEEKTEEKEQISFHFPVGVKFGVGLEIEPSLLGTYGIEYLTKKGYVRGGSFLSSIDYDNKDEILAETSFSDLFNMLSDSADAVYNLYKDALKTFVADIKDTVDTTFSSIKRSSYEFGQDLYRKIHLNALSFGRNGTNSQASTYSSYEITVYSKNASNSIASSAQGYFNEDRPSSEKETRAYTVGDPVYVYLTDENDEILYQFEDSPLDLTLRYDEQMLESADIKNDEIGNLHIYKYDEELCGYVCIGGIRDLSSGSITATITEAGQYIIAADFAAPKISNFSVSDHSDKPRINIFFDESSFFDEISVKLDGVSVVDSANWREYFNSSMKAIAITVEDALSEGEHVVEVYAVDSSGNGMNAPLSYVFDVDTTAPMISDTLAVYDDADLRIRTWCSDEDIDHILLRIYEGEELLKEAVFENTEDYYSVLLAKDFDPDKTRIVVCAYDIHDNKFEETIDASSLRYVSNVANDLWYILEDTSFAYTGKAVKPSLKVYEGSALLKEGSDYTLKYSNNIKAGKASITVTGKGNYAKSDTIQFDILPKSLNDEDISVSELAAVKENGKLQQLKPSIKWGKTSLKAGSDYVLEYNDEGADAYKAPGLYTVTVRGKGNYDGQLSIRYEIAAENQTLISKVKLNKIKDVLYDGENHEEDVSMMNGTVPLILGQDYTLSYEGDTSEIGTIKVTIKGVGKYSGTRTASYKITGTALSKAKLNGFAAKRDYNDGLPVLQDVYFVLNNKDGSAVSLKGIARSDYELLTKEEQRAYDYVFEYENNVLPGKAAVTYTGVNAYTGSIKKTYTIAGVALSKTKIAGLISSFVYDGSEKTQDSLVLTYQKDKNSDIITLKEGTDYELSYVKNDKAGTATVLITGKGLFTGSVKKTYKIGKYDIAKDVDEMIKVYYAENVAYSKGGTKPSVFVYFGDLLLKEGTDYALSFANNNALNEGSDQKKVPTIIITGKGNFSGTDRSNHFVITARDLKQEVLMSFADKVYSAKKNGWKAVPVLTDNGKKLVAGTDYDKNISYTYASIPEGKEVFDVSTKAPVAREIGDPVGENDILPTGTEVMIEVSGIKNYTGELSCIYRITAGDISKAKITVKNKEYTGKKVTLNKEDITITLGGVPVDPDDYEILSSTYKNNINKGKASVTLRGINNLGSEKTVSFVIGPKSLLWWWTNLWN